MSRRPGSMRARAARVAALVCVGALTLSGCDFSVYSLPLPGGADLGDHPYTVQVKFRDVLDLVPQSAVKVDDVTVGKVDKITLDGYTADVTVMVNGNVKLPDNAEAEIRQTSLLGEKFVSLKAPDTGASTNLLGDGDVIPLDRSGRNPEVEEVLGALSLLLNGGGVAQLKTIASELNNALDGRESDARSVLQQLDVFMAQLDTGKEDIVSAIESLNQLAISINKQRGSIEIALDELPQGLASIDRQRDDLVKMLKALSDLSSVGVSVIRDSKAATIDSLEALAPTLTKLAEAGDAFPKALQVFLTYPFVDAVVGKNPAQARNLHMGDYTNLSAQLDIDLSGPSGGGPPAPGDICKQTPLDPICSSLPDPTKILTTLQRCLKSADLKSNACQRVLKNAQLLKKLQRQCKWQRNKANPVCQFINAIPTLPGGGLPTSLPTSLPGLPGLGRAAFGSSRGTDDPAASGVRRAGYDSDLGALLVWGMVDR